MKKRLIAALSAVILCTSMFVACGGEKAPEAEKPATGEDAGGETAESKYAEIKLATNPEKLPKGASDRKDTLVVGMAAPKGEFLPGYASTTYDQYVVDLVFDAMIGNDADGKVTPAVAEKWEVSEDNKTYTFHLRKDVKFSNGEQLTAKDVAFTYTMLADPSYDGPRSGYVDGLVGYEEYNKGNATSIEGIKVIDEYTISFTYKNVDATAIWNASYMGIMPESVYKFEKGNIQSVKDQLAKPVGSGIYKFEHFKPSQEVKVVKNDNYYNGAAKIPNIVMKFTQKQTEVQELVSGSVDLIERLNGTQENIQQLTQAGFMDTHQYTANSYGYIGLNMKSAKLKDKEVRQALAYGLNRQALVDAFYQGNAVLMNTHITPASWAYNQKVGEAYKYDPDKANKMLDDAGWKDTNGNGVRDKDGVELEISWLTYTGSKYVETLTPIVIDSWEKIGVKVKPNLMEFASMADKVRNTKDFDIYNMAWSLSIDPDPSGIFAIDQSKPGGYNSPGWENKEADQLLKDALTTMDQEERKEIYGKWQELFVEDLPYICLDMSKELSASNSRVKNYRPSTYRKWTQDIHLMELK
ncbi:MAG: ABC transporter substrate-binding protein [Sarcina sp.]